MERLVKTFCRKVLGYAIWAETNADSIKAIWLESERKPEGIELAYPSLGRNKDGNISPQVAQV